jgi:hypothetical protein
MKKFIVSLVCFFGLAVSLPGAAYVITSGDLVGTHVGELDTLIGQVSKLKNSSPKTETAWVNTLLDSDVDYVFKTEDVNYFATDAANIFAFQLQSDPGYFLIKNATWWALYQNNAASNWGVIDLFQLNSGFNLSDLNGLTISHVTEFGRYVEVPEPSALILLCLGLLSLGLFRRRQKS